MFHTKEAKYAKGIIRAMSYRKRVESLGTIVVELFKAANDNNLSSDNASSALEIIAMISES